MPTARIHGEDLVIHATGGSDGPTVVLLHGLEDSWECWKQLASRLAADARCYAVKLPWSAGGDYRWRGRPPQEWIADALAAVAEPVDVLVAHSYSANAVIQRIAAGSPAGADALILISPFYRPPSVELTWKTFDRSLAQFRTTMTHGLRIRLGDRAALIEPDVFDRMAETMMDRIGLPGFLAVFEQFAAASGLDLSDQRTPTLVVAGSLDPGIAGERAAHLAGAMPHARFAVDPRYSHFCHMEQVDLIAPIVSAFLRETCRNKRGNATMPTLAGASTGYTGRPRYESSNISTFIGFKNFMLLAEDAVMHHFREQGHGPQRLLERHGLSLTLTSSSLRLTGTMHSDDLVTGTVTALAGKDEPAALFDVRLTTRRGQDEVKLANGRVRVQLVAEKEAADADPVPPELAGLVVTEVSDGRSEQPPDAMGRPVAPDEVAAVLAERSGNAFLWEWKIPYFACHASTRIEHSAYVKLLEEAVDRYLERAGLPITGLLAQRDWIPVVSRARVDLHADAAMGETLLITFTVEDVLKDTVFTARMECHVVRGDRLVRVATATIMHGYVLTRGPEAFSDLVVLDAPTQTALLEGAR